MSQTTHVNRGVAWLGAASTLVGVLDLVALLVILSQWVTAEEYGIATKCLWIFPILDQVSDLGMSAALIQRDDHTDERVSTVFWLNLCQGLFLFLLILVLAPIVATELYGHQIVGSMMIVYGTKLILQNGYAFPIATLKRQLRFKELSIIKIIANLAEFGTKIGFAAAGFGIWCFVLGPLARVVVYIVGTQMRAPFRPRWMFNLREARDFIAFGLRSSGSAILFHFYTNIDYPIVGFFFGDKALGLYKLAYELVLDPVRIISNVVVDAAFPAFSRLRNKKELLVAQFVSLTRLNLITVMTFAAFIFVAAPDLIAVLFPGYEGAIVATRLLCMVAVLRAVGFVAPALLDGLGRPDRTLRYMTVAAIMLPLSYVTFAITLGDSLGFESVAIAWVVGYPIAFSVLIYMATTQLGWSVAAYVREVIGVALCVVAAGAVAAVVHWALDALPVGAKLGITAATVVLVAGFLLAYTQGLSLRTAMRSLKDPPQAET